MTPYEPVSTPEGLSLEVLRRLLAKATERPWYPTGDFRPGVAASKDDRRVADLGNFDNGPRQEADANAALIVAAVNALPELLAAAEAVPGLEAALRETRELASDAIGLVLWYDDLLARWTGEEPPTDAPSSPEELRRRFDRRSAHPQEPA